MINQAANRSPQHFKLQDVTKEDLLPIFNKLSTTGYNEDNIIRMLDVEDLNAVKFPSMPIYINRCLNEDTPLNIAIKLFQLSLQLPFAKVEKLFNSEEIDILLKTGVLLKTDKTYLSTVDIFPCMGMYIATDQRFSGINAPDSVYYLGLDSYNLARGMINDPVDSSLDLCTGSGVQAILASTFSKKVTGVDINPRALNFASFNAMLNQRDNVEFVRGDLYDAVKGKSFDRIYVNPPFVPSPERECLFRDGSPTGEDVLMRVLKELPVYLKNNGLCQVTTLLVLTDEDYNEKLTRWIPSEGVHILTLANNYQDVLPYIFNHMDFSSPYPQYSQKLLSWFDSYNNCGIKKLAEGLINIKLIKDESKILDMKDFRSITTDFSDDVKRLMEFSHKGINDFPGKLYDGTIFIDPSVKALETSQHPDGKIEYKVVFNENCLLLEEKFNYDEMEVLEFIVSKEKAGKDTGSFFEEKFKGNGKTGEILIKLLRLGCIRFKSMLL